MLKKPECYFNDIEGHLIRYLDSAKYSIRVTTAWFYNDRLMGKLLHKVKASNNIIVEVITSDKQDAINQSVINLIDAFCKAGGQFKQVQSRNMAMMHNKYCIIDDKIVITGSFNWTNNATFSNENIAVINNKKVARNYIDNFISLMAISEPYLEHLEDEVYFTSTKNWVSKDSPFELHWEAIGADSVTISSIGQVNNEGSEVMTIGKSMYFNLEAKYGAKIKKRRILIEIIKKPKIEYYLEVIDPFSDEPLDESIYRVTDHVYLAPVGSTVYLNWEIKYSDDISLLSKRESPALLDFKGKMKLLPTSTDIFTLLAKNIRYSTKQQFTLKIVKMPELNAIDYPFPNINSKVNITIQRGEIPSCFSLNKISTPLELSSISSLMTSIEDISSSMKDLYYKLKD